MLAVGRYAQFSVNLFSFVLLFVSYLCVDHSDFSINWVAIADGGMFVLIGVVRNLSERSLSDGRCACCRCVFASANRLLLDRVRRPREWQTEVQLPVYRSPLEQQAILLPHPFANSKRMTRINCT